jgi:hypothetical protein
MTDHEWRALILKPTSGIPTCVFASTCGSKAIIYVSAEMFFSMAVFSFYGMQNAKY